MSEAHTLRHTTPGMRQLLLVASGLVFTIGIPLFLFPAKTSILFAWTIEPPLTAAFLGAAYWASFFLEFLAARERLWARARIAVPAVLVFSTLTLIATLLHLDKLHFGPAFSLRTQLVTWVWLLVYAAVPLIMTVLWLRQRQAPGDDPPRRALLPAWVRWAFGLQALVLLSAGLALFIAPLPTASRLWPWALSPLTGQGVGAWLLGLGVAGIHTLLENDLRRVRIGMVAYATFAALELAALARFAQARYPSTVTPTLKAYGLDLSDRLGRPVLTWDQAAVWLYLLFMLSVLTAGVSGWLAARRLEGAVETD